MKYYLHDSTAFLDEKVTLIYLKFGFEGVGLFYVILEKLALQEQPINEKVLKSQLNIRKKLEKQLSFMYEIGILSLRNGDVFNENLLNFSKKYQIKKEKTKKRVSEWRDKQQDDKNVTCYKHDRNARKVKESKVKESKVNIYKTTLLSNLKKSDFDNPDYFEITFAFYELFKKNLLDAGCSTTNLEKAKGTWIDSIRLLIEVDKQSKSSLQVVFKYLQSNQFWKKNILSTSKLRSQFDKLLMNAKNETTQPNKQQPATSDEQLNRIMQDYVKRKEGLLPDVDL